MTSKTTVIKGQSIKALSGFLRRSEWAQAARFIGSPQRLQLYSYHFGSYDCCFNTANSTCEKNVHFEPSDEYDDPSDTLRLIETL